jgi:hypothetical protein
VSATTLAFERGYTASGVSPNPGPRLFQLAVRIFELQRVAQLVTMQVGKLRMARDKRPIASDGRLGSSIANRVSLVVLAAEKGWLIRQLARELRG